VIHVFRMTTFFLIAGFFAHMSFHHRGALGFIKDRLQRIALPLLVGWPILFAVKVPIIAWAAGFPNGGLIPGAPPWPPVLPRFPLSHLWFLYVLLELYAAALVLRAGIVRLDPDGRLRAGIDRLIALTMCSRLAPMILAVPIGIVMVFDRTWFGWLGVRTPDGSLVTNLQAWVGFGSAFAFGWLLHRQIALIRILERRWLLNLVLALILITASLVLSSMPPPRSDLVRYAGAITYAPAIWTTSFAAIGLALRFLSGFSALRRYLADSSYWLYLIHLPILMVLQVAVSQLDWPWPIKFAGILLIALPLMLASYHLLVRFSFIGVVLNGRRMRREDKLTPATRAA
jgi:fucose 4-O-acetylase-like acetyltransferase